MVALFLTTLAPPRPRFLARPMMNRNNPMIYPDVDVAVLEIYQHANGQTLEERPISLSPLTYWNVEAQPAEPIYLFGYPNLAKNLPVYFNGLITSILSPEANYASDVMFGDAGSGGPALNENNEIIGVARARVGAGDENEEDDYTLVISLDVICDRHPEVCRLLPESGTPPEGGPPARSVKKGGFLQCLNARGPSFELGDRFVVPEGGDGTYIRKTPSWVINNQSDLMEEGDMGTIIQGPVCGPAIKGELIGWYVESDDGVKGWMSEGYIFNVIPWIAPEDQVDDWADFVPEDFVCLNSYGPNFQVGDRFIVPVGDGPTRLWVNPNREPRGDLVDEGIEGMILEGPVCARGNGGILVSWLVLTDTGLSGWASEGYVSSSVPWISPIVESSND